MAQFHSLLTTLVLAFSPGKGDTNITQQDTDFYVVKAHAELLSPQLGYFATHTGRNVYYVASSYLYAIFVIRICTCTCTCSRLAGLGHGALHSGTDLVRVLVCVC